MYKGKVLIVDDNEDVIFSLNLLLKPHCEAVRAATAPEKIAHFMKTFEPDVIFLDMNFTRDAVSGHEGFKYLEEILKADSDAVVIFMTAYADTDKAVRAIKAGATDFITKPWDNEELINKILSAIEKHEPQPDNITLKENEKEQIMSALNATDNNVSQASKMLGISRRTLYNKMAKYGL